MPPSLTLRNVPRFTLERTASAEILSSSAASETVSRRRICTVGWLRPGGCSVGALLASGSPVRSSPTSGRVTLYPQARAARDTATSQLHYANRLRAPFFVFDWSNAAAGCAPGANLEAPKPSPRYPFLLGCARVRIHMVKSVRTNAEFQIQSDGDTDNGL